MMLDLATLLRILRRVPDSMQARTALRMVRDGIVPPLDLLRRAGVRVSGATVAL